MLALPWAHTAGTSVPRTVQGQGEARPVKGCDSSLPVLPGLASSQNWAALDFSSPTLQTPALPTLVSLPQAVHKSSPSATSPQPHPASAQRLVFLPLLLPRLRPDSAIPAKDSFKQLSTHIPHPPQTPAPGEQDRCLFISALS